MGDFRASIKIEFSMGDVKDKADFWINWSPDEEFGGIDRRIGKWIYDIADRGSARIRESMYEGLREQGARETEKEERAELARLKSKYDGGRNVR